ncbi:hypothetical protein QFC19_001770 [Naganishia cerealis]|uniref:Uncharacterized protein n=1 Tax=Naganishia cerealis TaxID=610337 RepID=A0ACC2WG09_9TREE|nr:hypothetical protein QFC19_001770 [Naganishia cerealis]
MGSREEAGYGLEDEEMDDDVSASEYGDEASATTAALTKASMGCNASLLNAPASDTPALPETVTTTIEQESTPAPGQSTVLNSTLVLKYKALVDQPEGTSKEEAQANKQPLIMLTLIAKLYNFRVISCRLIYDLVRRFIENLVPRLQEVTTEVEFPAEG